MVRPDAAGDKLIGLYGRATLILYGESLISKLAFQPARTLETVGREYLGEIRGNDDPALSRSRGSRNLARCAGFGRRFRHVCRRGRHRGRATGVLRRRLVLLSGRCASAPG